jgi:predicted RNA-binding protein with PIN domain
VDMKPEQLLADAIEAARKALRDLDADQVPASMRRIAAYASGTLPPPFAKSLLVELESNEFLRGKALEAWSGEVPTEGKRLAGYRFLERGEGWLMDLVGAAYERGGRETRTGDRTLEVERDAYAAEAASLRERLKTARRDLEKAEAAVREASRLSAGPQRAERAAERKVAEQLETAEKRHVVVVSELGAEIERIGAELASAREMARLERRRRADAEAANAGEGVSGVHSLDPDVLADRLDTIASMVSAAGPSATLSSFPVASTGALEFPSEVLPDSAEAIEWLVGIGPATVFVDGYNLGFLLASRLDPGQARLLAEEASNRLVTASGDVRVVVVFDSSLDDAVGEKRRAGTAEVVFSQGSADDEIVRLVAGVDRAVVVSNDREVRQRCDELGAVALWAAALADWGRRR